MLWLNDRPLVCHILEPQGNGLPGQGVEDNAEQAGEFYDRENMHPGLCTPLSSDRIAVALCSLQPGGEGDVDHGVGSIEIRLARVSAGGKHLNLDSGRDR